MVYVLIILAFFISMGILAADYESKKDVKGKVKVPMLSSKVHTIVLAVAFLSAVFFLFKLSSPEPTEYNSPTMSHEDSLSFAGIISIDSTTETKPEPTKINIEKDYKLLATNHYPTTENYHLYYKSKKRDKESLQTFANEYRNQYCTKQCNVYLYDKPISDYILLEYPIPDSHYLNLADHFIAQSSYADGYVIYMYPYQDFHYKELGGRNWKKTLIK